MIARHTETLTVDIDLKRMSDIELSQREHYGLNGGGGFLPFAHPSLTHVTCLIPKHVPKEIIQIHFKRESTWWHTRKSMESRESVTRRGPIHAPRFVIDTPLCFIRQDLARLRDLFEALRITPFIGMMGARQFKIGFFDFGTCLTFVHP
jgi:hypothetical protein